MTRLTAYSAEYEFGPDQVLDLVAEGLRSSNADSLGGEDVADRRAEQGGDALRGSRGPRAAASSSAAAEAGDLVVDLVRRDGPVGDADALGVETRAGPMATPGETAMPRLNSIRRGSVALWSVWPRPAGRAGRGSTQSDRVVLAAGGAEDAARGSTAVAASGPSTSSTTSVPGKTSRPIRSQMFFPSARRRRSRRDARRTAWRRGRTGRRRAGAGRAG